ncbi:MAG: hypothetical protein AAGC85_25750 [Bacteroidota bacterium]
MYKSFKLYVLSCLMVLSFKEGMAQKHNGEIYSEMLSTFFKDSVSRVLEVKGEMIDTYFPEVELDSTSSLKVRLRETQIEYQKLSGDQISRKVSIPLMLQDSSLRSRSLSFQDTLSYAQFKRVYKNSPMKLKGDSPKTGAVWIKPIAIIGGTLGAILGLFLIRSS